jgi:hypothetical protein
MTYQKKARLLINIILVSVFVYLLWMGLIPFGAINYSYDFNKENSFISPLRPDVRLLERENGTQKIIADPVYFNLHTPRKMKEAELKITYKSETANAPIIEAGVMVDSVLWRYDLKPVQNKIIENLCKSWDKTIEGNLLFCQKEKDFNSIDDFLASTTDSDSLVVYNYNLVRDYRINDYLPSDEVITIDYPLMGAYQFYTYVKNETLDYQFYLLDQNKNRDEDRIDLNIYYNDLLIDTRHLPDDGNLTDNQKESEIRLLELKIPNLPEGVYKIELRVNNDIITNQIKTTQQITSFDKKSR